MGIFLYILATILTIILIPLGMIFGFLKTIWKRQFFKSLTDVDVKFLSMAVVVDYFGNIVCSELFNGILITKNANHSFGNRKETISSVLGKNEKMGTLNFLGKRLCIILNKLDEGHTLESIDHII